MRQITIPTCGHFVRKILLTKRLSDSELRSTKGCVFVAMTNGLMDIDAK